MGELIVGNRSERVGALPKGRTPVHLTMAAVAAGVLH